MTMIRIKYDRTRNFDMGMAKLVEVIKHQITKKDDDHLLLCVGATGTGKSSLMLHVMDDMFNGDPEIVKFISLTRDDFANALKESKDAPQPRFCANDEANISKRDALTKYNKDVIDLYMSIRGLNIFHWWNNPSIEMIDKPFIEERIKSIIFVATKDIKKPRLYYYFNKKSILKIWEKYGNLKLPTLKKVAKKYAKFRGWFRKYEGNLLEPYLEKKDDRMHEKVENFFEKYTNINDEFSDKVSRTMAKKQLGVSDVTIYNYEQKLKEDGKLKDGIDVFRKPNGRAYYTVDTIELFKKLQDEGRRKLLKEDYRRKKALLEVA